jgi:hypothetical protein
MSIPDGGPAFPRPMAKLSSEEIDTGAEGMKLRDYFAAAALTGLLARLHIDDGADIYADRISEPDLTHRAYAFAAAMLAQREKQP